MTSDSGKSREAGLVYVLPTLSQDEPSRISRAFVWAWITFLILVGLAVYATWLLATPWYIRLAGNEARGTLLQVQDCGANDDGDETLLMVTRFRDAQGQLYELPSGDECGSGHKNGDTLVLWYLPTHPTSTLSFGDAIGMYIGTTLLLLIVVLGGVWPFLRTARSFIRLCKRAEVPARLWPPALAAWLLLALLTLAFIVAPPLRLRDGPPRDYRSGETVQAANRWAVTVQGGQRVPVVLSRASRAGDFCLELDFSLRNITNQALSFSTDQFTLYGPREQAITAVCAVDIPLLHNARLLPGQRIEGKSVYEVPASFNQLYLAFQPDPQHANDVARFFWRLQVTQT